MQENIKPYLLVFLQFLFIILILITGPIFCKETIYFLIEIAGILLAFWAVIIMKIGNFRITPLAKKNGVLITSGPYAIIRHPMYLATLIVMMALVSEKFTYLRLSFLLALIITLLIKLHFEEKQLIKQFKNYSAYQKKSSRLLPYIF